MFRTRLPNTLFFAIVLAGVAQCFHDFPLLPDRVASHFGASGMPNGWMTKPQFFTIYAVMLLPALAVEFWVARRIARTDGARLNMPNKDYWLSPERRAATFAYFTSFFAWYGCALLALLVFVMGLAMRANLDSSPQLPTGLTAAALAAFVLFNVAAIVAMFRRFSSTQ
jgi:uncharacterized membrane protein